MLCGLSCCTPAMCATVARNIYPGTPQVIPSYMFLFPKAFVSTTESSDEKQMHNAKTRVSDKERPNANAETPERQNANAKLPNASCRTPTPKSKQKTTLLQRKSVLDCGPTISRRAAARTGCPRVGGDERSVKSPNGVGSRTLRREV